MAQKRFGPTLDAGTVIIERDSEKSISPAQLGSTAMVGVFERGKIGEVGSTVGKRDFLNKYGSLYPYSLAPDAAIDFWDHSNGAGVLFPYRVTDGSEVAASLTLWDRKWPRNPVVLFEADNGGAWGGKRSTKVLDIANVIDIDETEITLPIGFIAKKNEWKGGMVLIHGVSTNYTYQIIGNDKMTGVATGKLYLALDSKADTDYGASTDKEIVLSIDQTDVWGRDRQLAVRVNDGQISPSTEFGIEVYLNDSLVKVWPDLSMDPNAANYFVNVINEDTSNHFVKVTNLWTGAVTAACRPANYYAPIADSSITAKAVKPASKLLTVDVSEAAANTIGSFTFGSTPIADIYEIEYNGTTWDVTSQNQSKHAFPDATGGVAYVADNPQSFGFTITESGVLTGDKFTIYVQPFIPSEAVDGRIFLTNVPAATARGYVITSNDYGITDGLKITSGDLTVSGTIPATVNVMVSYKQQFSGGYDGIWELDSTDFDPPFDPADSKYNDLHGKGYGLIKFCTPGINELANTFTSVDPDGVQKVGVNYVAARNHQFRVEFAANMTDESAAKDWLNNTMGRSDYEKICFPSYAYVADPVRTDILKLVCTSGMILGREALSAKNFDGYHKVAAGVETTLPRIRKIPTLDRLLNGEMFNPAGIQRIEKKGGNYVVWGARIPFIDPAFKFCQKREYLSYVEHVLSESFDWIVFAINDEAEQPRLVAALQSFFLPEWRKRALRGKEFKEACAIKIDAENNTNATRAAGDLNCEITLRIADTIERFVISIGQAGLFETSAA